VLKRVFITAIFLILTSCGGGGGGGGSSSSGGTGGGGSSGPTSWIDPTTEESNAYKTAEYNRQWGLEAIHAADAYGALAKNSKPVAGDGVIVGVTDTQMQLNHSELSTATNGLDHFGSTLMTEIHGTHVAGIVAAAKNNTQMHGVAYNARILEVQMLEGMEPADSPTGLKYATDRGAKVINMSWGFDLGASGSTLAIGSALYNDIKDYMLSEVNVAIAGDALMVVAAGNDAYTTTLGAPAILAQDDSLSGNMIAVASIDSSLSISSFSDRCSVAKNFCLAAPGGSIYSSIPTSSYANLSGTSMAAPHVSGAAAVLRAAWPHLTAAQTAQILLTTATDLGAPGVDNVYGHGLLNLAAAVQAQGNNTLSYGASVASSGYDIRTSRIISDPAFGDAFSSNVAMQLNNAVFFDDYGRDYRANLGSKISSRTPTNIPSLDFIAFNQFENKIIPLSFGKNNGNKFNFIFSNYQNESKAQNFYGLKYIVLDNSQDPKLGSNNGFSFVKDSFENVKDLNVGFAFNSDESSRINRQEFANFGSFTQNNFAANPFQNFMRDFIPTSQISRKFNQVFAKKEFLNQKFSLQFSYQNSYESNQINIGSGNKQNQIMDFGLGFKGSKDLNLLVSFGTLNEFNNNFLNSKNVGAFQAGGGARTQYAKVAMKYKLFKDFYLMGSYLEGISKAQGNEYGIFRGFSDIKSNSSSVALLFDNQEFGKFGVVYSEPLRVYSGRVNIDIPVARDLNGNITRYQTSASLASRGKERDYEIFYNKNLNNFSNLGFNLVIQKQPGNIRNAQDQYLGFLSYKSLF